MGIAEPASGGGHIITNFVRAIFSRDGSDPFLEDIRTLWLIHWQLSTYAKEPLFAWDYMLNRWQYPEISRSMALQVFQQESQRLGRALSTVTLGQHFDTFLHTYVPTLGQKGAIHEDNLDCPLVELELIQKIGERKADNSEELIDKHLHVPFAYPELRENLRSAGIAAVKRYLQDNGHLLDKIEHSEQVVEIHIAEGMVVNGRIDLIRRTDTSETIVVDFKSTRRAQEEDVTRQQLHIYAMGYRELTGQLADLIEIHNLDQGGARREEVDLALIEGTAQAVTSAGNALRENRLPRLTQWSEACKRCDHAGICRNRP